MTNRPVIEAKRRKPALNPAAKVLGRTVSPEVDAEVDKFVGKLLSKGKNENEYTEQDIIDIFKHEPDWSQQDLVDLKTDLENIPKVEVTPNDGGSGDGSGDGSGGDNSGGTDGLDDAQLNTLDRMEKIMGNMTLKQIKILRAELKKEAGNENV